MHALTAACCDGVGFGVAAGGSQRIGADGEDVGFVLFDAAERVVAVEGELRGIEGAVDRYVAMTRATQQLVILHSAEGEG